MLENETRRRFNGLESRCSHVSPRLSIETLAKHGEVRHGRTAPWVTQSQLETLHPSWPYNKPCHDKANSARSAVPGEIEIEVMRTW